MRVDFPPTPEKSFNINNILYYLNKSVSIIASVISQHKRLRFRWTSLWVNSNTVILRIHYLFSESTLNSLSFSRIHLEFTIFFAISLSIHYRFGKSLLIHCRFREFTICFANSLSKFTKRKTMVDFVVHHIAFADIRPFIKPLRA